MRTFVLHLQGSTQYERVEGVTAFLGQDASGAFGVLAGHERLMTALQFGLARFRVGADDWQYLALPKAILYVVGNEVFVNTRRYVRDRDYARVTQDLDEQLRAEESALRDLKDSLQRLEEEMFKRLWRMGRKREAL